MVLRSVYFMVKFRFFIPELWDFIHQIVGDFSYVALQIENPLANSLQISQLLELMVLRSVYFMVKFRFLIPELWDFIHQIVGDFSYVTLQIENPLANSLQISQGYWNW
jgi:hypothetical protein